MLDVPRELLAVADERLLPPLPPKALLLLREPEPLDTLSLPIRLPPPPPRFAVLAEAPRFPAWPPALPPLPTPACWRSPACDWFWRVLAEVLAFPAWPPALLRLLTPACCRPAVCDWFWRAFAWRVDIESPRAVPPYCFAVF
jgi:hypothetical protein